MKLIISKILLLCIIIVCLGVKGNAKESKTILICIDGCNSSLLDYAYSPVIQELIKNATYSTKVALRGNAFPTSGWATLLTGAYSSNHGVVVDSTWEGNNFAKYPLLFDRMKAEMPGMNTRAIVSDELLYEIVQSADNHELLENDDNVESSILNYLETDNETSFYFLEFKDVFNAGVNYGFDNSSIQYVNAFSKVDERIGNILDAIENRPDYENEDWSIIVTSNHGGNFDGTYGGDSKREVTIPVIISGDNFDYRNMASGVTEAKPDRNNSIRIDPESTKDYRYVMVKKTNTKLEDMQDFTVEFKVYASPWTSDPVIIGDKDWGWGGNPGWLVCRRGSGFKFQIADTENDREDVNSSVVIEDGDWHHVAVSFEPQGYCYVYTDGVLSGETKMEYPVNAKFNSPFDYLAIGNEGTLTYNNWKGIIDEVRIWDVALSGETINEYYKTDHVDKKGHPNLDDLLLYYKMDGTKDQNGSVVVDAGPYEYNGTLVKCERVHVAPLKLADIYPTLINKFGGTVLTDWLLNGNVVKNDVQFILGEENTKSIKTTGSHYPNPIVASQVLNVILPEDFKNVNSAELKVIDLSGVVYQSEKVFLNYQSTCSVKTNGLKSGFYIYSIRSGDRYLLGKFKVTK